MRSRVFVDETTSRSMRFIYKETARVVVDQITLYTGSLIRKEMRDVVTPRFHREQANGRIINSPKFKEELSYTQFASTYEADCLLPPKGSYRFTSNGSIARVGLTVPQTIINNEVFWLEEFEKHRRIIDLAVTRAHANVDVSEMMLIATLGELPETLTWLRSLVTRFKLLTNAFIKRREVSRCLVQLGQDVTLMVSPKGISLAKKRLDLYRQLLQKRADRKVPKEYIGAFGNAWLEYRYAVRPLISDIANAVNVIRTILARHRRFTARGKETTVFDNASYLVDDPSPLDRILCEDLKVERKGSFKASAGVLYVIETTLDAFSSILALDQPIASLYELVPFSFMLDWFIGVGDWLRSLNKSSGLGMLSSWITLTTREMIKTTPTNARMRYMPSDTHQWVLRQYTPGSSFSDTVRVWRYPNPPIPPLPSFDLKLDLSKILDIGIITRQMLSGQINPVVKRS